MWDVRLLKPVKHFYGNVNEVKVIPFVMDSSESIMASGKEIEHHHFLSCDRSSKKTFYPLPLYQSQQALTNTWQSVESVDNPQLVPATCMQTTFCISCLAGDDGKTRIWSVHTGEVLKTIHETNMRNGYPDIPAVCLGENWALRSNMMAFGLGMEDKLKLYF